jgi:hypothetical protein
MKNISTARSQAMGNFLVRAKLCRPNDSSKYINVDYIYEGLGRETKLSSSMQNFPPGHEHKIADPRDESFLSEKLDLLQGHIKAKNAPKNRKLLLAPVTKNGKVSYEQYYSDLRRQY